MTTVRAFKCNDLLAYNDVNVDALTETYGLAFYLQYLATWPEYFSAATATESDVIGYVMGKCEGKKRVVARTRHCGDGGAELSSTRFGKDADARVGGGD